MREKDIDYQKYISEPITELKKKVFDILLAIRK